MEDALASPKTDPPLMLIYNKFNKYRLMTDNDIALMAQADGLNIATYWDGDALKEKCDSEEARAYIDAIMRRMYHYEEAKNDMI